MASTGSTPPIRPADFCDGPTKAYTPDADGYFDIGGTTHSGLERFRRGVTPEDSGATDERSNGNGSLMRILPLAIALPDIPDEQLVEAAHRSSAITHGHSVARATCALYSLVVRRLLAGAARADTPVEAASVLRSLYAASGEQLAALDLIEAWAGRSGRGYVVDSFWSAWDAFAGSETYREAIVAAVRYGNDTDTTACIAGGLGGVYWGIDAIPAEWLDAMRGKSIAMPLVDQVSKGSGHWCAIGFGLSKLSKRAPK